MSETVNGHALPRVSPTPKIVTAEAPVLRQVAKPIEQGLLVGELLDAMIAAMNYPAGIGLAAPQIGLSLRAVVVMVPHGRETIKRELINPTIYEHKGTHKLAWEGCLSFPRGWRALVARAPHIKVRAYDRYWNPIDFGARDLVARVIQHEVDHLNGVLASDRATRIDDRKGKPYDRE